MTKLWLDGRYTVTGGSSHINLSNPIALHDFIADYLAANPSVITSVQTLAQVLVVGDVTGGLDINISDGDVIKAVNGGGQLNLRDGADGTVNLTTDNGGFAEGFVNLSSTETSFGFNTNYFYAAPSAIHLVMGGSFAYLHPGFSGMADVLNINTTTYTIATADNSAGAISYDTGSCSAVVNSGSNANPTVANAGVVKSAAIGGVGITMKTDNSAYANQLALNASGSAFEGLVDTATLTADRTYEFPDASGSVRIIRYIAVASPTVHTAVNGEIVAVTTGAGDLVVNLPAANLGVQQITIKKVDVGAGKVNITAAGADTIDGAAFIPLNAQWNSATLVSNDSDGWYVIATV